MNRILRSSQDFGKKTPPAETAKLDLTAGPTEAKSKYSEPKGLIIPGTGKDDLTEELIESSDLSLPDTTLTPDREDEPEDANVEFYRATVRHVGDLMSGSSALDIGRMADYAYEIIERVKSGPAILQLAMRPTYLESFLGAHPVNIAILCALLVEALRYDEQQQLRAVVASLLHDIGMSRLDPEILQHQRELTDQEKDELRQHPNFGAQMIREQLGENYEWLARVVEQEHERAQGQGYPNGLMLEAIDPIAQIIGLLDVYEALTHPRRQHEAASPNRIIRQIIESKDQFFSPVMIKALLQAVSVYPIETYVLLNNGQIGRVIATQPKHPLRPLIELHTDHNRKSLRERKELDLGVNPVLSIVRALDTDEVREMLVPA